MNHFRAYTTLIRKALKRGWTKKKAPCYTETHHIFPVCVFGKNKNTVTLTAREHYIAHALLEKIALRRYGSNHRFTKKLSKAFWAMNNQESTETQNRYFNSRLYLGSRQRFSDSQRGEGNPMKSEGSRRKKSESSKGKSWYHNPQTGEERLFRNPPPNWIRGRSELFKRKNSLNRTGELHPLFGKPVPEATRAKLSLASSGQRNPMYGRSHSTETKNKISETKRKRGKN